MEVLTFGKIKTTNVTKGKYHADYLLHRFPLGHKHHKHPN